jgi:Uma2 family endonuclease
MPLNLTGLVPPISLRPAATLTDEELMRLSNGNKPYRIERNRHGEISIMTPAGGIGSTHEMYVANTLYNWSEAVTNGDKAGPRGIAFGPSTGFNLPDWSCLSPDASWLALDRWDALTPELQAGFPPLCPSFIIEVRSKSDSRSVLEEKTQLWLENGMQLAWLIDPSGRNVTIFRPDGATEVLHAPETAAAAAPVQGFALRCNRLWA